MTLLSFGTLTLSGCLKTRAQLKDQSDDQDGPSRPVPSQVQDVRPQESYVVEELRSEVTRLTGKVDELERGQSKGDQAKESAHKEEVKKLETRIIELEQAQVNMLEAIKKLQTTSASPADANEIFERAKSQFDAGDFENAAESFGQYLKTPKPKHLEDATFLRGQAYYEQKQYKKAIIEFSKFPEKHPKSKHLPAALLKIGQSFDALGMKEDAKGFYQELLDKFPKSPEAKKYRSKKR